jgi:GntR family transcriptional regulator, transcriptional repressor for pyruvate dehydrogenase complex
MPTSTDVRSPQRHSGHIDADDSPHNPHKPGFQFESLTALGSIGLMDHPSAIDLSEGRAMQPAGIFHAIDATRGWEEVSAQIREAIVTGKLQPGDRLPPQRDLAAQFGVSRALINEALRVLEHSGLLYIRPGAHGGSFVRAPKPDELVRHLNVFVRLGGLTMDTLTDFRFVLEGQNAAWAAKRATTAQIEQLRQIVREVKDMDERDRDSASMDELDAAFHMLVAEMAHNELSLAVVQGIVPALRQLVGLLPSHAHLQAAEQMAGIAKAITTQKEIAARDLMGAHIRHWADVLVVQPEKDSDLGGTT